jgi:phenylpropionate dioxygenase-like ring-hydroxylating dioxygenase large terminal subunit
MSDMKLETAVNDRLAKGLLNVWYPVLPSYAVSDAPVGITRLSENIVIWRGEDGRVHALEDRCPHRGARLSMGWNLGDKVACWYHGVEVNHDGTVADVPAAEKCPMVGEERVRSYPVEERHGAIFLFFSDGVTEPTPLDLPDELASKQFSSFLCTASWQCNYRYAVDNVMDPMHGAYLHAMSHSMAEGDKTAKMRARKTGSGFVFEKTNQTGVNFDWVEWGETNAFWMRLSIPYQQKFGPGGPFFIIGLVTPVDEHNTQVFFWRARQVSGWQRDVWRFLYRTKLEELHWNVLEQDRVVLEAMAPDARDQEFLYDHDVGLSRVRRILEKKARAQVEQMQVAAE